MRRLDAAVHALRAYRGSTLFVIGAAAIGFATTLSILGLARAYHLPLIPATDLGVRLSTLATSPGELQRRGLEMIGGVNVVIAVGVLAISAMTILAVSLARADLRHSEMRVRRAVGASRKLLLTTGVIEGGITALAAAVAGITIAALVIRVVRASWSGTMDPPALLVPLLVAAGLAALIVLGALLPVVAARRISPPSAPSTIPPGLIAAALQLGVSCAVLLGADQLRTNARHLASHATGQGGDAQVLELRMDKSPAERSRNLARLIDHDLASVSSPGALAGLGTVDLAITECGRCSQGNIATPLRAVAVAISSVSPDSFRAMSVRLAEGRLLRASDDWNNPRAVVINRALAHDHFEGGNAVGRRLQLGDEGGPGNSFLVVGTVEDRPPMALGAALQPPYTVYTSVLQVPPSTVDVLVPSGPTEPNVSSIGVTRALGRQAERWAAYAAPLDWFARALATGGGLILLFAMMGTGIGIYQWVSAVMPELAIRRAVGARRRDIGFYVVSRIVAVAALGVVFGLILNDVTSIPLAAATGALPVVDRRVVVQLSLVVLGAALLGASIPAWRVTRMDPAGLMAGLEG